jgi:hypothetical protein
MVKGISTHYMEFPMKVLFIGFVLNEIIEDLAKKEEEVEQQKYEQELEITHFFKKTGDFLYIVGEDWPVFKHVPHNKKLFHKYIEHNC